MMLLTVWTPSGMVLSRRVEKVSAMGVHGSFCLLPKHVDAVAGLRPGLLSYARAGREHYLAVNQGCLTKKGVEVTVVTTQAFTGESLEELSGQVETMLHSLDQGERRTRAALAGLESRIARGLASLESSRGRG